MPPTTKATEKSKAGTAASRTDRAAESSTTGNPPSTGVANVHGADGGATLSAELIRLLEESGMGIPINSNPHWGDTAESSCSSSDESSDECSEECSEDDSSGCSGSQSPGEPHRGAVREYLSLICAPKNYNNPNPRGPYECHPSKGKGSWIVMVDTGCTIGKWPHEFLAHERDIRLISLSPPILHGAAVTDNPDKYIWRNNMEDEWADPERPVGHGTAMAITAAGSESGVAPLAHLAIYKVMSAVYEKVNTPSGPIKGDLLHHGFKPHVVLCALENLRYQIARGAVPKGKTVLNLSLGWLVSDLAKKYYPNNISLVMAFEEAFENVLKALAMQGVTIVTAAGRDNGATVEEGDPGRWSAWNDSVIVVGGTDSEGRLWWKSTPGTRDCPVHLYAQARGVPTYNLQSSKVFYADSTSFAASQAAGLAAYFLAHPDYQERFRYSPDDYGNKNTVGKRMKDFLKELAYQRLPVDKLLHPDHRADYRFPNNRLPSVDVLYNGYHGDQK